MNIKSVINWKTLTLPVLLGATLYLMAGCSSPPTAATPQLSPLERALVSGKPTLAEFGRGTCEPCKEMEPILKALAVEYETRLNVEIINVDAYRVLTRRYEIMAIPTQIFFDSNGREIDRHVGFYPREDIITQLKKMGIQ